MVLPIDYSLYEKTIPGIFVYLFIFKVTTTKVSFRFYKSAVKVQHVLFANEPFLRKTLIYFFSSNIPLCIEKNLVEKLCKVLENLRRTPQSVQNSGFSRGNYHDHCGHPTRFKTYTLQTILWSMLSPPTR